MADRSWFFASEGAQQGPYPEAQLRQFIANGTVSPETLVWTEGMANWQKAGDIPGLLSAAAGPPAIPQAGGAMISAGGQGGALSITFGIWEFIWRSFVLFVGILFIIPVPWVVAMYCRWIVSCARVPGRPNLAFTGRAVTLMWFYAVIVAIIVLALISSQFEASNGPQPFNLVTSLVQLLLDWLLIRWFVANISSDGQPLGLKFSGSFWAYVGWNILTVVSFITIIGWAWVYTAQARWLARNIQGTRREVLFNATGLELLWRSVVTFVGCLFIIPIPWVMRWFIRWQTSQFALVERSAVAAA